MVKPSLERKRTINENSQIEVTGGPNLKDSISQFTVLMINKEQEGIIDSDDILDNSFDLENVWLLDWVLFFQAISCNIA